MRAISAPAASTSAASAIKSRRTDGEISASQARRKRPSHSPGITGAAGEAGALAAGAEEGPSGCAAAIDREA